MSLYQLLPSSGVFRTSDFACIPDDPRNRDWQDYLLWVSMGNVPDPVDPVHATTEAAALANRTDRDAVKAVALIALLSSKTPAQVDAYVVANLTDLASAKIIIRSLAQVVGVLARDL